MVTLEDEHLTFEGEGGGGVDGGGFEKKKERSYSSLPSRLLGD